MLNSSLPSEVPSPSIAKEIQPIPFTQVHLEGGWLGRRQLINQQVTLPFALRQCEISLRLKNFDLAAETLRRRAAGDLTFQNQPVTKFPFDDTDVYKSIEAASYSLSIHPDPDLLAQVDGMIKRIEAAQEPDGYLYTWRTMHPDGPIHPWVGLGRWDLDPDLSHELYNLGHLYEAGVAHAQATGQHSLLNICLKSAGLIYKEFQGRRPGFATGHPIIEMGLAKLYRLTRDPRWLELARTFIDNRGRTPGGATYCQNHLPVIQQTEAVGHAVRANYLYAGMADFASLSGDPTYLNALQILWNNVVERKLHLTGGCGAREEGEAYGENYELPHACYNETCAAIAFLFWSHRMFLSSGEARYMDVFERTLYNGTLSGVSLSGDRFFYPNVLEYDGHSLNNREHAGRAPWFGCACCPPNLLRLLASLGDYVAATRADDEIFVNLYTPGIMTTTLQHTEIKLRLTTDYPWSGDIVLHIEPATDCSFTLCLRLPGWVNGSPLPGDLYQSAVEHRNDWSLMVNDTPVVCAPQQGYLRLHRTWRSHDQVRLRLALPLRCVRGNHQIAATRGQVALERGPIVYAFEGVDNGGDLAQIALPKIDNYTLRADECLQGVQVLDLTGAAQSNDTHAQPLPLTAVPYAVWANRGLTPMRVWIPEQLATSS